MFQGKRWSSTRPSALQWMKKITNNGPGSWGLILLFGALFLPLSLLHMDEQGWSIGGLGPFMILSVFPIIVGSFLRGLPGGLVVWFLMMADLLFVNLTGLGSWCPTFPCIAIGGLITTLVTGRLRYMSHPQPQEAEHTDSPPCPCSQFFTADEDVTQVRAPSGQKKIEKIWQQLIEQAGYVAATSPQALSRFDRNRYQMAMEVTGAGLYDFDIARRQHFWSKECKALLGLPPDAQEDFALFRSLVHPEDRERVFSLFAECFRTKTPHKVEYRLVRPDGSIHWLADQGIFLYDQQGNPIRLIGVAWDITALKQAEEACSQANEQLQRQQAFLHTILCQMPSGMIIAQAPSGKILGSNEEALRLLGLECLEYETYEEYAHVGALHPDGTPYRAEEYPLARAILSGETIKQEVMFRRRADGYLHPLSANAAPITDSQDRTLAGVMILQDISEQYELERQKDEFFCQIGHELRTPLTALKGNLQLTERHLRRWLPAHENLLAEEEKLLLQRLRRWNEQALRQANVENHLIENLLDASALQAAGLHLSLEPRNLVQVVSAAVDDLQTVMPPHTLFYETCERSDIPVMVDEVRVGQVITQYVKNALHAAAERSPILVGIFLEQNAARVWVKDAGPGLSCEQQISFWKLLRPTPEPVGSQCPGGSKLDLSLYLCRELVRLHRGQIGVESVPGEGSTFWFSLPLRDLWL